MQPPNAGVWDITASTRIVVEELTVHGPLSRADLARRLGLSPASLTKITKPLIQRGWVDELPLTVPGGTGRPSQPLDINPDVAHVVGIKLTGDTLFAVLTDSRARILRSLDAPLADQRVETVVRQISEAVQQLRHDDPQVVGVGIALSGNATRDEPLVRRSPFLHWQAVPLGTLVSDRVGLPTTLENDVRALTTAAHWFGVAAGLDSFAMLTFGAGIGCGIVTNGHQVEGRLGASGLIGHLPIDDRGPMCYAGHRGCAHAFATIGGVAKTIRAARGTSLPSFEECLELFERGDPAARSAFIEAARAIGQLIATVVNIIGPEKVLISGEGIQLYQFAEQAARDRVAELLHWTATEPEIVVQPFGFGEWARGAAAVAIQQRIRQF